MIFAFPVTKLWVTDYVTVKPKTLKWPKEGTQ